MLRMFVAWRWPPFARCSLRSASTRRSAKSRSACRRRSPRSIRTTTTCRPTTACCCTSSSRSSSATRTRSSCPGLATSWKALDDLTWEFKLRKNVHFHDGSPFTAEDVAFTLQARAERAQQPLVLRDLHQADRRREDRRPAHDHLQDRDARTCCCRATSPRCYIVSKLHGREGHHRGLQLRQGGDRHRSLQVRRVHSRTSAWCSRPTTATGAARSPGTR